MKQLSLLQIAGDSTLLRYQATAGAQPMTNLRSKPQLRAIKNQH
jgi:hypothetical protein